MTRLLLLSLVLLSAGCAPRSFPVQTVQDLIRCHERGREIEYVAFQDQGVYICGARK